MWSAFTAVGTAVAAPITYPVTLGVAVVDYVAGSGGVAANTLPANTSNTIVIGAGKQSSVGCVAKSMAFTIRNNTAEFSCRISCHSDVYDPNYRKQYGAVLIWKVNGGTQWQTTWRTNASGPYCLILKEETINKLHMDGDAGQCHGTLARLVSSNAASMVDAWGWVYVDGKVKEISGALNRDQRWLHTQIDERGLGETSRQMAHVLTRTWQEKGPGTTETFKIIGL